MDPRLMPLADLIVEIVVRELMSVGELPGREAESQPGVFVTDEKDYEHDNHNTRYQSH